jgi:FHA domain/Transcriptional regulatory protein, C terminal
MEAGPVARERGREAAVAVFAPDGELQASLVLAAARLTVGRLAGENDIALGPDPERLVTRVTHCALESDGRRWYVVDGGSINGTFLRRDGALARVRERMELRDGDQVCILASIGGADGRRYFELAFRFTPDAEATQAIAVEEPGDGALGGCLRYDAGAAQLVLVRGDAAQPILIRPQAHRLVRHMVGRNAAAGTAALCTHEELIGAVWAGEPLHSRLELAKLVWELRRKLAPYGAERLIESERGLGYRLHGCSGA